MPFSTLSFQKAISPVDNYTFWRRPLFFIEDPDGNQLEITGNYLITEEPLAKVDGEVDFSDGGQTCPRECGDAILNFDELRRYQAETQKQIDALSHPILVKAFSGELCNLQNPSLLLNKKGELMISIGRVSS